jgi:predicted acyl esterase
MLVPDAERTTSVKALTVILAMASALTCLVACPVAFAQRSSSTCTYTESIDVPAGMRDGTILRSNVFTPKSRTTKTSPRPSSMLNFPMFDRNPNTGQAFAQDADLQVADQIIYHDVQHPSAITLPIVLNQGEPDDQGR